MIPTTLNRNYLLLILTLTVILPTTDCCETSVDTFNCKFHVKSNNDSSCTSFDLQYCQWRACQSQRLDSNNLTYCADDLGKSSSSWGTCMQKCCSNDDDSQTYDTLKRCYDDNQRKYQIVNILSILLSVILMIFAFWLLMAYIVTFKCFLRRIQNNEGSEIQINVRGQSISYQNPEPQNRKSLWVNSTQQEIDSQEQCAVCLDNNTLARLNCSHLYHFYCIFRWIKRRDTCPVCIRPIKSITVYCKNCLTKNTDIKLEEIRNIASPVGQLCDNCS